MRAPARTVLIRLSLLTLFFGAAGIWVKHSPRSDWYLPHFPLLLVLFAGIYFFFAWSLLVAGSSSSKQFINRFILFTGIKLFLLMILIIAWLLLNKMDPALFLVYVLVLYSGFSILSYSMILAKKNYDN